MPKRSSSSQWERSPSPEYSAGAAVASLLLPFVVVTCGYEHPHYKMLQNGVDFRQADENDNWWILDLTKELTDPARKEQTIHGEDSSNKNVQIAIYTQDRFATLICDTLEAIEYYDAHRRIFAFCRSGHHRADTFGASIVSAANRIKNPDGSRKYNAIQFPLHKVTKQATVVEEMKAAESFWYEQYFITNSTIDLGRDQLFAFNGVCRRPAAMQNFTAIYDYVDEHNNQVTAPKEDRYASAPWSRKRARMDTDENTGETWQDADAANDDTWEQATSLIHDANESIEPWMVAGPTDFRDAWLEVLREYKVDTTAQRELFALSQAGNGDYRSANGILAKLLKKTSDNETLNNPSAFVHSCVKNARNGKNWR